MGDVVAFPEPDDPPFRKAGMGYIYEPAGLRVRFRADFLKRRGEELHGVLTVESVMPGVQQHLHEATHNFSSMTTRASVAKYLAGFAGDIDWRRELETFCVSVMRHERTGEPFIEVGQLPVHEQAPDDLEILLPRNRITWLFGEEGAGKGTLAVAWMVGVATGQGFMHFNATQRNVAYLDWEDDTETMDRRIKAVSAGLNVVAPAFFYRHLNGPLASQVNGIAQQFDALDIGAYVVDSAVLAAGVGNEHGDAADTAHGLVGALGVLNRTVLVIDHIAKAEAPGSNRPMRPYGSVMKRAWARQAWELRKDQEPGQADFKVGLYHNKFNHGTLQPPLGIRIEWSDNGEVVRFSKTDIRESPTLIQGASITKQMEGLLLREPGLGIDEIAAELKARPDTISRTLRRYMGTKFTEVRGGWTCLHQEYGA